MLLHKKGSLLAFIYVTAIVPASLAEKSSPINNALSTIFKPQDYSTSPPFFPAPNATGSGAWKDAVAKAGRYIEQFDVDDLVNLVSGVGWSKGKKPRCIGNIASNDRLHFPGLCLEDGPAGVRAADLVTFFPASITTAAAFSSELTRERGKALGQQFRRKGVNIALTPGMNMHRSPAEGRIWEYLGADPYLAGESAFQTIKGIQSQGVQACAKHFIGSEQESGYTAHSANIDERTLREVYLHAFLRAVQADVATVMCAYPALNNSYSCQNSYLLNGILKTQLGFQGTVLSDWGAAQSGVASALSGMDMMMPGDIECCDEEFTDSYWRSNLTMAIKNGSVPEWRVRDMGVRILAGWYLVGQDSSSYPRPNFDAFDPFYGEHRNVMKPEVAALAREVGAAGSVLLKNTKKALPLKKTMRKMAVIGNDAAPAFRGANYFEDRAGIDGIVGSGWGSGTSEYSYLISPYEALQARARQHGTGFYWSFDNFALGRASSISDERLGVNAAIVFVAADSGEGYLDIEGNTDRKNLTVWQNGNELIKNVSATQSNTIVVIHAPGQVDVEAWIDNPNVTAVIHAHFQGSEAGNSIADILFGDVNPSARLPYTMAKKRSDYPADIVNFTGDSLNENQLYYNEKLHVDYRHFDANNIEPRFPFGFGLSYTSFNYSNMEGHWLGSSGSADDWNARNWSWPIPDFMFEDVYSVSFDVTNTGDRDGHEVPQVYLGFAKSSGEPPKVLRRFDRFAIKTGEKITVTFRLNRYDLSVWSSEHTRWIKPGGDVAIYVGASSRDIRLTKDKM